MEMTLENPIAPLSSYTGTLAIATRITDYPYFCLCLFVSSTLFKLRTYSCIKHFSPSYRHFVPTNMHVTSSR